MYGTFDANLDKLSKAILPSSTEPNKNLKRTLGFSTSLPTFIINLSAKPEPKPISAFSNLILIFVLAKFP